MKADEECESPTRLGSGRQSDKNVKEPAADEHSARPGGSFQGSSAASGRGRPAERTSVMR